MGTQLPPRRKGHSSPPIFGPCLLWQQLPISGSAELLLIKKTYSAAWSMWCDSHHCVKQLIGDIGRNRFVKTNLNSLRIFQFGASNMLNLKSVSWNQLNHFTMVYCSNPRLWSQQKCKFNVFCMNFWPCFPMFVTNSHGNHILLYIYYDFHI